MQYIRAHTVTVNIDRTITPYGGKIVLTLPPNSFNVDPAANECVTYSGGESIPLILFFGIWMRINILIPSIHCCRWCFFHSDSMEFHIEYSLLLFPTRSCEYDDIR